jgi:thioredoxin 1
MVSLAEYRFLSDVDLKATIAAQKLLTLVLFITEGNGLCYLVESGLMKIPGMIKDKVAIFKIDHKINKESVITFGIQSVPTLLFFQDGKLIDKIEGLISKKELISRIKHNL